MPARQEEIISLFVKVVKAEKGVLSCFLSGSLALGEGDDLSDIDITVVTKDGKGDAFFAGLQPMIESIGPTIVPLRTETSKRSAVFIFSDLVEMSVTVSEESELRPSPVHSLIKSLFDTSGIAEALMEKSKGLPTKVRIEALISTESLFLWGTLAVRKRLFRDSVWDARDALEKLRYLIVRLINLRDGSLQGYKNIERTLDPATLLWLSKTASAYDKDAVLSALAASFDLFVKIRDEVFAANDVKPNEKATEEVRKALLTFR